MQVQHWYHLSHTWDGHQILVVPRVGRIDDPEDPREHHPFIAVCPTVEQCMIAVGELQDLGVARLYRTTVYRTTVRKIAVDSEEPRPADWVFDYRVTQEHRFYEARRFQCVGTVDCTALAAKLGIRNSEHLAVHERNLKKIRAYFRTLKGA